MNRPNSCDVQLDFIFSNSLAQVEHGIETLIRGLVMSKMALCIALANMKKKALYRQAGLTSFREYLRSNRIGLNYQTAHEYAKIGEAYLRHRERLQLNAFREECGLKKLLLLECALRRHDSEEVFLKLVDSSYREFKRFATGNQSECARTEAGHEYSKAGTLMNDDECIFLLPSGQEVIWFNSDLEETLLSPQAFQQLKRTVFLAIKQFMDELGSHPSGSVPRGRFSRDCFPAGEPR